MEETSESEQYAAQYAAQYNSASASCRSPSPYEQESCQQPDSSRAQHCSGTEAQASGFPSASGSQEVARSQGHAQGHAHGRKHARDRNGSGAPTRPHTKKGQWSEEEEMILATQHLEVGNKWTAISKLLPLRSDNDVKNHWNSTLRSKSQQKHCTFLWLYAKDVEPVADSEEARQACFEAAHRAYEQLRDSGCCQSGPPQSSSQHTRSVRRGASSTALIPRALSNTPGSRATWGGGMSAHNALLNPVFNVCHTEEETEDSQCLSAEHMGGMQRGASRCLLPVSQPEYGVGSEDEQEREEEEEQMHPGRAAAAAAQMAGRARARGGQQNDDSGSGGADSVLFVMPSSHTSHGADGTNEHDLMRLGNGLGPSDQPQLGMYEAMGGISSGSEAWDVPTDMGGAGVGAASSGMGAQWATKGMWATGAPCASPGLPAVTQPGVSLEAAIAMDLEDTSFDGLDVATFLRMRNPTADQILLNGAYQDAFTFQAEGDIMADGLMSVQAPAPSSYNPADPDQLFCTTSRDPSSDRSSGLNNHNAAYKSPAGMCTSATAGSTPNGFSFNPQQQSGGMSGFMPVAATTTPDLLGLGLSHQQDGLQGELEQQQAGGGFTFEQAMGGAASGADGWAPSSTSNAFNVLGLSPRASMPIASGPGPAPTRTSKRVQARHSIDLPLHSTYRNRGAAGGPSMTGQGSSSSAAALGRSLHRYASVNAGPGGSAGGLSAFGRARHHVHQPSGLMGEAMPVDPNDPGSGDGSSIPTTAVAHRHTSPADQLPVNSAFGTGTAATTGLDQGSGSCRVAAGQVPWGNLNGSWSGCLPVSGSPAVDAAADDLCRLTWSVDGTGHPLGQPLLGGGGMGGDSGAQNSLWPANPMAQCTGSGLGQDECEGSGMRMGQWESGCEQQWAAIPEHNMAFSEQLPALGGHRTDGGKPHSKVGQASTASAPVAMAAQQPGPAAAPGPRLIIHSLPESSKWNTAVAAAKGWPTAPYNRRQQPQHHQH